MMVLAVELWTIIRMMQTELKIREELLYEVKHHRRVFVSCVVLQ